MDATKRSMPEGDAACKEGKEARIDGGDASELDPSRSPSSSEGNQVTSGLKASQSSQIGAASSPHPTRVSIIESVVSEFRGLRLTAYSRPDEVIKEVGREVIKDMKPGRCLIGNAEEEAEFYRPKPNDTPQQGDVEHADEPADVEMKDIQDEETDEPGIQLEDGDFLEYQGSSKKPAENVEEELGHYERLQYGNDYIQLPGSGELIPVWEYLGGADWKEKLYNIQPLPCPENMIMEPRSFQLKAAAQGLYCIHGPFKLFLLGDEMGVGKTLPCVLMIWELRKQPGMCIVLCPKSLCQNWVNTIHGAWEEKEGLRAFIVDDSSITQAQLLAGGYDVLVCSYEFYAANGKKMEDLEDQVMAYANNQAKSTVRPRRATTALQSEMWKILNMPFKVAFLDEAQRVNKPGKHRHESIKRRLAARAFAIISGTLPHNKWYDLYGYLDFGQNHPFDTVSKFLHCVSDFDQSHQIQSPSLPKLRLLQKFLQPMLVARPASILRLKDCEKNMVPFQLLEAELPIVTQLAYEYERIAGMNSSETRGQVEIGGAVGVFGKAVKAQMAAFHPMIAAEIELLRLRDLDHGEFGEGLQDAIEEEYGDERDNWLQRVKARPNIVEESGRVTQLLKLYDWGQHKYPDEKIIIFSSSLKFLDIVAEAFLRTYKIQPVRFDGSVPVKKRQSVERAFRNCPTNIPLLITMNAGGVGLNIEHASIVIITEPQWNRNAEAQAIARAYRQGQTKTVKGWTMVSANSEIDSIVYAVQRRKTAVNAALMGPLIREPDQGPADIELLSFPGLLPVDYE